MEDVQETTPLDEPGLCRKGDPYCKYCMQYVDLMNQLEALKLKIEERTIIEKAKWKLVEQERISEEEAHRLMMKNSRSNRQKLVKTAEHILTEAQNRRKAGISTLRAAVPALWLQYFWLPLI